MYLLILKRCCEICDSYIGKQKGKKKLYKMHKMEKSKLCSLLKFYFTKMSWYVMKELHYIYTILYHCITSI